MHNYKFINFIKSIFYNEDITKMPSMWFGGLTIIIFFIFFNFFYVEDFINSDNLKVNLLTDNILNVSMSLIEWLTFFTVFFISGIFCLNLIRKNQPINFFFQKSLSNLFYFYIFYLVCLSNFYFLGLVSLFYFFIFLNNKFFFDFRSFNSFLFYLCIFLIGSKILWWDSLINFVLIEDLLMHINKFNIFLLQNEFKYFFLINKIINFKGFSFIFPI